MTLPTTLCLTCAALAIEAACGYPRLLFARIGHPVSWIGALIAASDRRFNQAGASFRIRRLAGLACLALWLGVVAAVTLLVTWICGTSIFGFLVLAALAASLPAQRSLHDHVRAVAIALDSGGLDDGRRAVGAIVGRNTAVLDQAGVVRAAIESLAENFSDGVVAPVLWLALGGLPGGALYKAINTADSMVGHRTPRHEAFGWASARLDDLVNLPASRLAALWLILAGGGGAAARAVWRDAGRHRSPNAGWPEAAMAGALDLRLAGPRVYGETLVDDAYMGDGRRDATVADLRAALALYRRACILQFLVMAGLVIWRG